jgi:hypothetical protein
VRFQKKILIGVFSFLILFVIANLIVFWHVGNEPGILIGSVFAICGFECGILGWLKKDERKIKNGDDRNGNGETEVNE